MDPETEGQLHIGPSPDLLQLCLHPAPLCFHSLSVLHSVVSSLYGQEISHLKQLVYDVGGLGLGNELKIGCG